MYTSRELQAAINAAKKGGKIALNYFQTDLKIEKKVDNSVVTIADIKTEEAIIKEISNAFPDATFVAEESGGDRSTDDYWIIDPIDGTRVYVKGIALWSILIAHYKNGEITSGVCYFPVTDTLLTAEKGKGAFLNNDRVTVSNTKAVNGSFGNFGSIRHFPIIDPILNLKKAGVTLRSFEHAYALSLLAEGKMDILIDAYGKPWDYAPFICIVQEAGGKITDFQGNPWNPESKNLLATNGMLHDEIVKIINKN